MDVCVLVKSIPDPSGEIALGEDLRVRREGDGTLDPGDEFAVEAALQLTEASGGEVTVLTMGPEGAGAAVRRALSMGAHRAVVVTDTALGGADALATARVLAAALRRQPFDLVLGGVESTDGSTGTVPVTIAELLDLPSATFAKGLEASDGVARIRRQTEEGFDDVEVTLPAVVTLTAGATEPRYPTLKGIMGAKQKPLETLGLADLGLAAVDVAPTQRVLGVEPAPQKAGGEVVPAGEDAVARIADLLADAKVL